jgi:hypothetical protein
VTGPADALTVHPGSAAVANLLRLVRAESDAAVAFAAVPRDGGHVQIFAVPAPGAAGGLDDRSLEELARMVSADPELPYARALVRSVQGAEPRTVAAAAIPGPGGLVAVVAPDGRNFDAGQLDALHRVAVRLSRHFQAFDAVRGLGADASGPEPPPAAAEARAPGADATAAPTEPEWSDAPEASADPGTGAPAPPDRGPSPEAEAAGRSSASEPRTPVGLDRGAGPAGLPEGGSSAAWVASPDGRTGLPSIARFFSRVGRLLSSDVRDQGAFALVLIEIPTEETAPAAATALTSQLRFSDPVARIDRDLFAAAVVLVPGSLRGDVVEERLGGAVRGALEWLSPVRTTHVLAEPGDRRDVDDLLRLALSALPGRLTGGGGAPWRGAGGSAARLPFP